MKSQAIRMCAAIYALTVMLVNQAYADDSTRTERESRKANQEIETNQWHISINTGIDNIIPHVIGNTRTLMKHVSNNTSISPSQC